MNDGIEFGGFSMIRFITFHDLLGIFLAQRSSIVQCGIRY